MALALVAGCSSEPPPPGADPKSTPAQAAADVREAADDGRIACSLNGAAETNCQLEQREGDEGPLLVLSHPDGGFRRLLLVEGGAGIEAADGAENVRVSAAGPGMIEVRVGNDRYRLPAEFSSAPPVARAGP